LREVENFQLSRDFNSVFLQKLFFTSLPLSRPKWVNFKLEEAMDKGIESKINISKAVRREEHVVVNDVVINEVPVADVQVQVSESTVVDGDVDPRVVVKGHHVQGEI
jgi:hypothetical protein